LNWDEPDTNIIIGALLLDLAASHTSKQSAMGYERAAKTVLGLDDPIESFAQADGSLRKIPNIGPKSERVILEVLRTGESATAEQMVGESAKASNVLKRRGLREHFISWSRVRGVLSDATLGGPTVEQYRGDLQMHSTFSDGTQTLADIVEACIARGYEFSGLTDHSYGLAIAGGMSMSTVEKQHQEVDALNAKYEGHFRLIKGIEANIRPDGSIDMTSAELARLELVLAAPHSELRSAEDQTRRMITAVETPGVHILAHPRGRVFGSRGGVRANWDEIFGAVARAGIAIEIDGDPMRQDLDFTMVSRAKDAGCLFALDSDAHSRWELRHAEIAIAHARLAGVPSDRVINCWPVDRLLEWLAERRAR
jgi:histidinol phosphatase-like PHP family hydrolase